MNFFADLTKMLIEANIPIEKVNDPSFRTFMSKYTKRDIPSAQTLRTSYVTKSFDEMLNKIREEIGDIAIHLIGSKCTLLAQEIQR